MRSVAVIAILLACGFACAVPGQAAEVVSADETRITLNDIGTRLQFDFYIGDASALRRDLASLGAIQVSGELDTLKAAHAAFGEWKLAEVLRGSDTGSAGEAARRCSGHLEKAIKAEPARAAFFALLSVCQRLTAELLGRVRAPLEALRSRQNLERALSLAPRDPRVLLMDGINQYERFRGMPENLAGAHARLTAATAAYADATASPAAADFLTGALDWGHAEAWAYLGRVLLEQRNVLAARDAFEHAIVLAGDYREVQQILGSITGPR